MVRNITDMNEILDHVLSDTDKSECSGTDLEKGSSEGDSDIDWKSNDDKNLIQLVNSRDEEIADDNTQVHVIEQQETKKTENVQNNYEVHSGFTFSESSGEETRPPENSTITPLPAKTVLRVRTRGGGRVRRATGGRGHARPTLHGCATRGRGRVRQQVGWAAARGAQ